MRPAALERTIPLLLVLALALAGGCDAAEADGGGATGLPAMMADTGGGGGGGYAGVDSGQSSEPGDNPGHTWTGADAGAAADAGPGWPSSWPDSAGGAADASSGPTPGGGGTGTGNVGPNGECLPSCEGKQCGPDGCGGTCGWCSGDGSCQAGVCVEVAGCTPACAGQMIGVEDGCGGVCSGDGFGIGLVPGGAQDAAYFRKLVGEGQVPSPDVLPVEGWLTEHGTALPPPEPDRFVTLHGFVGLFYDPAEGEPTVALQLGMNSAVPPDVIEAGRFNLSVVVDRSGSMAGDDKIVFVRDGLIKMLDALDEDDYLSIVTYSSTATVALPPTKVTDKQAIIDVIEGIQAGGSTNLYAGLKLGYEQVLQNIADKDATPRVVLLSDGMATEGITDTPSILAMSGSYNEAGVGLTTIGAGTAFNFELMHGLATQGLGNFYFIDGGEKLAQVFEEEIRYLLTPVADNLKVWFTLPDGFGVDEVYGFEFTIEGGEVQLLGPTPQYTVEEGGEEPPPVDPGGEDPDVTVSTLFASKKNGLLMVKLDSPGADLLAEYEQAGLSTVYYSYELVDTGELEAWDAQIEVGSLEYDTDTGGFSYFSGAIMQKNFCVLRLGLAMKEAARLWHEDATANLDAAIKTVAFARTFCQGINVQLGDPQIDDDVALATQLMDNLCGDACVDPAAP